MSLSLLSQLSAMVVRHVDEPQRQLALRHRFSMLAMVWAVALLSTALLIWPRPEVLALFPLFPTGLFFFVQDDYAGAVIGWAVYGTIIVAIVRARDAGALITLLALLCALLTVNVAGCCRIASHMSIPGAH
jgi:hypothetical protein